jgi:DNA gyrase/topoisomerase IV subunit B
LPESILLSSTETQALSRLINVRRDREDGRQYRETPSGQPCRKSPWGLLRVSIENQIATDRIINELMGKDPSARFRFIMDHAEAAEELDV